MKKYAVLLMIITFCSSLFGFTRDIVLSFFYGATYISDAYLISLTIPSVIFSFIATGVATSYIPMYSRVVQEQGIIIGRRYTNNLTNVLLVICTTIVALGLMFTTPLVKLFASGFEGDTLQLAVRFTKISLFAIYFTALVAVARSYLQLKQSYLSAALVGFPLNICIILSVYFSTYYIIALSVGYVVAIAAQLIFLLPFLYRQDWRYQPILKLSDPHMKSMLLLALPVALGVSVNQINMLVDRTIASNLAVGGISALHYANMMNNFVQSLFVISIITVMYPMISKMAAESDIGGVKNYVFAATGGVSVFVIPISVGAMLFAEPLIRLMFGRGAFGEQAIEMTSYALFFYAIGMVGFGLREVLSRAFYALQDTKTPMINAAIAVALNIVLNIILSRFLGIGGLALATSIGGLVCALLLALSLRKKLPGFGFRKIGVSLLKIIIASIVMGVLAKFLYSFLLEAMFFAWALGISIFVGAMVYFISIYFLKLSELEPFMNSLKARLVRKSS